MIYQGDCLDILPTLEPKSIQCCVTSPPYYGLRDYGCAGQIGLEPTPDAYVEKLVAVFREVRRVLKDDGTLWLNLGDSYNGSGGAGGDYNDGGLKEGQPKYPGRNIHALKPKDLIGIPWRVAFASQADGWYLRQDIIWAKPNPMPESVTDRCTKSHEYIFLLTKSARYYYNNEAIGSEILDDTSKRYKSGWNGNGDRGFPSGPQNHIHNFMDPNNNKRQWANKKSVWSITTQPYKEAHFATFPEEIPRTCILAGSKKGDTILDPFSGAGTTGVVAEKLNRKYIGIELNPQYTKMAEDRIYNVQPLFAGLEL
jgi:DNA modification methylase